MKELGRERSYLDLGLIKEKDEDNPLFIIPKDLCTRCGACHVICPVDVVRFEENDFPFIETGGCIDCGLCLDVCPGIEFDMHKLYREMYGQDHDPNVLGGCYRSAYIGYAGQTEVRAAGASGGVVTEILLHLLEEKQVDGAVVIGSSPENPLVPMPLIARSEEEIFAAAQSKYSVVANTKVLRDLRQTKERFAFVGVACQIHGLKKLQQLNKRMAERSVLTIGLACKGTLERQALQDLLRVQNVDRSQVKKVNFRGGPFPGKFQVEYHNGEVKDLSPYEYKDGAFLNLMRMYTPARCHLCPDYTAEFADISCSDSFLGDESGEYRYKQGWTVVICRSERGERVLREMVGAGKLHLEPLSPATLEKSYSHHRRQRKAIPFMRIEQLRKAGRRAPEYHLTVKTGISTYIYDIFYRFTYIFTGHPRLTIPVLRFLYSPAGIALIGLKVRWKKYRRSRRARSGV